MQTSLNKSKFIYLRIKELKNEETEKMACKKVQVRTVKKATGEGGLCVCVETTK